MQSGLDSQTAWSICALLRKLANNGQAILCTIHQPSAILFQEFDRLLFLARGGKTVYFGDIGERSETLTKYFERQGARPCGAEENPAEWMIEIITAKPEEGAIDWPQAWRDSPEKQAVKATLAEMRRTLSSKPADTDPTSLLQYAAPFKTQIQLVLIRVFQQYWRTPVYLFSKIALCMLSVSLSSPPFVPRIIGLTVLRFCSLDFRFTTVQLHYRGLKISYSRYSCS